MPQARVMYIWLEGKEQHYFQFLFYRSFIFWMRKYREGLSRNYTYLFRILNFPPLFPAALNFLVQNFFCHSILCFSIYYQTIEIQKRYAL